MSPLVAGREPAKSATDASSREAPFSSWLGRLFTHRFSRRAKKTGSIASQLAGFWFCPSASENPKIKPSPKPLTVPALNWFDQPELSLKRDSMASHLPGLTSLVCRSPFTVLSGTSRIGAKQEWG